METGEDVLASEEGASQGCSADQSSSNCIVVPVGSDQRSGRKKKLRRNVTFPDDARLVRALDPVDPWENGKPQGCFYCRFGQYLFQRGKIGFVYKRNGVIKIYKLRI